VASLRPRGWASRGQPGDGGGTSRPVAASTRPPTAGGGSRSRRGLPAVAHGRQRKPHPRGAVVGGLAGAAGMGVARATRSRRRNQSSRRGLNEATYSRKRDQAVPSRPHRGHLQRRRDQASRRGLNEATYSRRRNQSSRRGLNEATYSRRRDQASRRGLPAVAHGRQRKPHPRGAVVGGLAEAAGMGVVRATRSRRRNQSSRRGLNEATYSRKRDQAVPSRPQRGHLQPEAGPSGPVVASTRPPTAGSGTKRSRRGLNEATYSGSGSRSRRGLPAVAHGRQRKPHPRGAVVGGLAEAAGMGVARATRRRRRDQSSRRGLNEATYSRKRDQSSRRGLNEATYSGGGTRRPGEGQSASPYFPSFIRVP